MPQPRRASPGRAAPPRVQQRRSDRAPQAPVAPASSAAVLAGPLAGMLAGGAIGVGVLPPAQVSAMTSATVAAMRALSIVRLGGITAYVTHAALEAVPELAPRELRRMVAEEKRREAAFRRRQLARIRRDLPRALREPDDRRRLARVQAIANRERVYGGQREEAMAQRTAGAADAVVVEQLDPLAAVWQLGPRQHHTPDCVFLHGRALAWEALRQERMVPPVHNGCGCRLRTRDEAWREGLTAVLLPAPTVAESLGLIRRAKALVHGEERGGPLMEAEVVAGAW